LLCILVMQAVQSIQSRFKRARDKAREAAPYMVYEHPVRIDAGDGAYAVRVFAQRTVDGYWAGWLEFLLASRDKPVVRTGRETTQATLRAVAQWSWGVGRDYLGAALQRALRQSGAGQRTQPVLVAHGATVLDEPEGIEYRARIYARRDAHGSWIAWIEFEPQDGHSPVLSTNHESSQPSLNAVIYWALGLEPVFFEGALERAIWWSTLSRRDHKVPVHDEARARQHRRGNRMG
jgi:hypothetical protein